MAISYRYDTDKNILWSRVTGCITTGDMVAHIDSLLQGAARVQGLIEMIDMNRVEDVVVRYSDLVIIKEETGRLAARGHKISIVFANEARSKEILQVLGPVFNQINVTVHICDTSEEALAYADALIPNGKETGKKKKKASQSDA